MRTVKLPPVQRTPGRTGNVPRMRNPPPPPPETKGAWERYASGEKLQPTFGNGKPPLPQTKVEIGKVIRTRPVRVKAGVVVNEDGECKKVKPRRIPEGYSDISTFIIMLILIAAFCLLTFKIF